MRTMFFAAVLALSISFDVRAAQWYIGSASGTPGSTVSIAVWIYGDGVTSDAQLSITFDEARLALPVAAGDIPGAAVSTGAYCTRTASARLSVLKLSGGSAALPVGWTQVCSLPFAIRSNAAAGQAFLNGMDVLCAAPAGPQSCSANKAGVAVAVAANAVATPSIPDVVAVLLAAEDGAPTPEALAAIDYATAESAPLSALIAIRPRHVRPLITRRPKGDFAQTLATEPDLTSAKLNRFVLVEYRNRSDAANGLALLEKELMVEYAVLLPGEALASSAPATSNEKGGANQYHLGMIQAYPAWMLAGGWSLVGVADSGVDKQHPDLQSLVGATYVGGNHLPAYDYDASNLTAPIGGLDFNVDELQPVPAGDVPAGCLAPVAVCNTDPATAGNACMQTSSAGHGTHVSGLIAANTTNADASNLQGVCRHCGLAIAKAATTQCVADGQGGNLTRNGLVLSYLAAAVPILVQTGSQVVNISAVTSIPGGYCDGGNNPNHPWCLLLKLSEQNDVIVVAASGNARAAIQFPASDARVVAVGGIVDGGGTWDRSPGGYANCPLYNSNFPNAVDKEFECGTNYTVAPATARHQELVAPAENVRSTFYRGMNWNVATQCGDFVGDEVANGDGLCTGTSMSAPVVSGIFGLLRSINPLLPKGEPAFAGSGLRHAVAATTDRAVAGLPWDPRLGFGVPNLQRAAERVLGRVRGTLLRKRVTPLFTLYSAAGLDFASVASPQSAAALIRYMSAAYSSATTPAAPLTPGYAAFKTEGSAPAPRANAYVLTTEFVPNFGMPAGAKVVPLFWLDRTRRWPSGCVGAPPSCFPYHRDSILVSTIVEVEGAVAQGYAFRGRQGYVYGRCPADTCMPAGTEKLYRYCHAANDDCAIFLQSQLADYQALGYIGTFPAGSDPIIGYAYPNIDSDGDGLIDGFELLLGTSTTTIDSDGDGLGDGMEFPQAGVSISDPCSTLGGPLDQCSRPIDLIKSDGFE